MSPLWNKFAFWRKLLICGVGLRSFFFFLWLFFSLTQLVTVAASKLTKPSAGACFYRGANPEPLGPLATLTR